MGQIFCSETSVRNYRPTLRKILKDRRFYELNFEYNKVHELLRRSNYKEDSSIHPKHEAAWYLLLRYLPKNNDETNGSSARQSKVEYIVWAVGQHWSVFLKGFFS
jgi:hypothetical protein